jgi:GH24 family phage-related lysozyme (muramidase)
MANRRDPRTGRVLSKFESLALDNQLAAKQHGQSAPEQAITEIEFNVERDTSNVRSYIDRLVELVRENIGSAADLQRILPLIDETVALTKEDPTLSKAERERIARIADALRQQVRQKTALFTRISSSMRNVAREKTSAARDKASDVLQGTDSAIGKLAGKLLQRRDREQSGVEKALLSARGDLFQTVADSRATAAPTGKGSGRQVPSMALPESEESGAGFGGGESDKLLRHILDEVVDIRDILKKEAERNRLRDEQSERDIDNKVKGDVVSKVTRANKNTEPSWLQRAGSYLSGLLSRLGGIGALFGTFGRQIRGLFGTVLSGLRSLGSSIGNLFSRITLMVRSAVTGAFDAVSSAASRVLGLLPDAVAILSPVAVAAAQMWVSNKLAGVFNELQQKYPFLNSGTMTDTGRAVVNAKQNVQAVLSNTQQGKNIQPVGGVETTEAFNVRHQLGMSPDQYRALPETDRTSRENNWKLNHPGMGSRGRDVNLMKDSRPTAAPPVLSIAPLGDLPGQRTNVDAPPAPNGTPRTNTSPTKSDGSNRNTAAAPTKNDMHMSESGLQALKTREGLPAGQREGGPYTAYYDSIGRAWTIGHGLTGSINGRKIQEGMVISAQEEDTEVRRRVRTIAEPDIKQGLKGATVAQNTFDSLVSVSYNTGPHKAGFNLARKVSQGHALTQADFMASATAKNAAGESMRVHGLENRRLSEYRQASFSATPAANRAAAPLVAAAAEGRGAGGVTIVAPQVVNAGTRSTPQTTYVPMPIMAENNDDTLRALRNIGGI